MNSPVFKKVMMPYFVSVSVSDPSLSNHPSASGFLRDCPYGLEYSDCFETEELRSKWIDSVKKTWERDSGAIYKLWEDHSVTDTMCQVG